jgi:AcrR family transcriptional regulator
MRRLAAEVAISKSALYEHFTSQEELQLAVIGHGRDVFEAEVVSEYLDNADRGPDALLERWLAFFEGEVFPGGCFFIVSAVDFANRPGRVRDALEKALDREVEVLEAAVRQTPDADEPRTEQDVGQTAFELHAILLHAHALFQIKRDPAVLQRARAALRAGV